MSGAAASATALPDLIARHRPWHWPVLLAGPALVLTAFLPRELGWICELAAIIVLGVPHGALDGEIARDVLRPRLGWAWFPVFSLPYLSLFAFVLAAWYVAPLSTLAIFLAASVWHFGSEDAPAGAMLEALIRGGLPIALPVLLHPAKIAFMLATIAHVPFAQPPDWLWAGSLCWLVLAVLWLGLTISRGAQRGLVIPGVLAGIFIVLPPLAAFAIYFVCVHAPTHTAALIHNPLRARRVYDDRSALILAFPLTGLTLLIGAASWPLYTGQVPERLLSLTIQILAALTLPHMLLDTWLTLRERSMLKSHNRLCYEQS